MTAHPPVERGTAALLTALRLLLYLYPAAFRHEFGAEVAAVLHAELREAARNGYRTVLVAAMRAVGDLIHGAAAERVAQLGESGRGTRLALCALALSAACLSGYIHLRSDADRASLVILLFAALVCGATHPRGAWRWAAIIGLGIPTIYLAGPHLTSSLIAVHAGRDHDSSVPLSVFPALVGAYAGVAIRAAYGSAQRRGVAAT